MPEPTAPPSPPPAAPWWAPLQAYAGKALTYLLAAGLLYLSVRLGLPAPPAPSITADVARNQVAPAVARAIATQPEPPEVLYFCGTRRHVAFTAKPWPTGRLTWHLDPSGYKGDVLTAAQLREAMDVAFKSWAHDLEIDPQPVADPKAALVRMSFVPIDGQYQVLAQSELADGTLKPKSQEYDAAEPWTIASNPGQATIDLVRVAAHELGHALGLDHDSENSGALMAPVYSRAVRFPTARDIDRAVALGYKRRVATGPNPSPPAPTIQLTVSADPEKLADALRKAGYQVEAPGH